MMEACLLYRYRADTGPVVHEMTRAGKGGPVRAERLTRPAVRVHRIGVATAMWLVILAVCIAADVRPRHVTVNGQVISLRRQMTVADCAQAVGITRQAGDLVSVRGSVLLRGGGQGRVMMRNGRWCRPQERVRGNDSIFIKPADDVVEPTTETARRLSPVPCLPDGKPIAWRGRLAVHGLQRVSCGQISGLVGTVEWCVAQPVVTWKKQQEHPTVALTFDDGPHRTYTPQILDILKRYNAHATFFVLGSLAKARPDLIRRISAQGHEIGIHTWRHARLTRLTAAQIRADISRCAAVLAPIIGAGGPRPRWVRPPYGAINSSVRRTLQEMGYRVAMWSVDPDDWRRPGAEAIYRRVMARVRDGSIVLMHDGGGNRSQTVAALARIVPELQSRGYRLVTMSQQAGLVPIFEGEVIIQSQQWSLRVRPVSGEMKVFVDGKPVKLQVPPVTTGKQIMLPIDPLLKLLGASYVYDAEGETLRLTTVRGTLLLRLNSQRANVNGREVKLQVPPILYQDSVMFPLWLMANSCQARVRYDEREQVIEFTSYMSSQVEAAVIAWQPTEVKLHPMPDIAYVAWSAGM